MKNLLWPISIIFLVISSLIICANIWISLQWYIIKKRGTMIPFIGGITGALGLLLLPINRVSQFCWVPPIIDLGCCLLLAGVLIEYVKKLLSDRRKKSV
jgi:hypothetical protein